MTNREAIEFLKNMIDRESIGFVCPKGDGDVAIWQYHVESLQMAISALEKREGKKPIDRSGWPDGDRDTADGLCPVCGSPLVCCTPRYYSKHEYYCRDCGQRIDWSDEHGTD